MLEAEELEEEIEPQDGTKVRSRTHSRSSTRSVSSSSLHSVGGDDEPNDEIMTKSIENIQQMETSSKGKVKGSLFGNYFRSGGNLIALILVGILFLLAQVLASSADYWVSFWYVLRTRKNVNFENG